MIWLLAAWLFWLATRGRLAMYAGFASTSSGTSAGSVFSGWSIPVNITVPGLSSSGSPAASVPADQSAQVAQTARAAMPSFTSYNDNLPASDQTFMSALQSAVTGFFPSGLPAYGTLAGLNRQAVGNVAGGGGGL